MKSSFANSLVFISNTWVAIGCCANPPIPHEAIRQNFDPISISIVVVKMPAALIDHQSNLLSAYNSMATLILKIDIGVSGRLIYMPFDAYAGLGDPISVDVREIPYNSKKWRMTLTGGDASTAYCALINFDEVQVRTVDLFRNCKDQVPYAAKHYAPFEIFD